MSDLTQKRLKRLLHYDADTGLFRWCERPSNRIRVGDIAGSFNDQGYRYIKINGKQHRASRLAWLYVFGESPESQVDHINGTRGDDRITNLRLARSQVEQQQNQALHNDNTSGYPGVSFSKVTQKWRAQIFSNGTHHHLGYFDEPEYAAVAYREAKARLHKFNPTVRDFTYGPSWTRRHHESE